MSRIETPAGTIPAKDLQDIMRGEEFYSHSRLSSFQDCQTLYRNSYVLRLGSTIPKYAADFGTLIHLSLAELYRTRDVRVMMDKYRVSFGAFVFGGKYTYELGEDLLTGYIERYHPDPLIMDSDDIEIGFLVRIVPGAHEDFEPFWYGGKIDGRGYLQHMPGVKYTVDHKTTGSMGDSFANKFRMDDQTTGYEFATKLLDPGTKSGGVIINALCTTKKPDYQRLVMRRSAKDIERFRVNLVRTVHNIRVTKANEAWTNNTSQCSRFGACEFIELCNFHHSKQLLDSWVRKVDDPNDPLHMKNQ